MIKVNILDWKKRVARPDVTNPSWFKFPVDIFENAKLFELSPNDLTAYLYVMCQAVKEASPNISLKQNHIEKLSKLSLSDFSDSLAVLASVNLIEFEISEENQILPASVTSPLRPRIAREERRGEEKRIQVHELENSKRVYLPFEEDAILSPAKLDDEPRLPKLALLWNQYADDKLARVKQCKSTRMRHASNRWKENPSDEFWIEVISQINASSFCTGLNNRGWKADFDWLIRPETSSRVLEGKYTNRPKKSSHNESSSVKNAFYADMMKLHGGQNAPNDKK